jgi:hypothetical protein
LFEKKTKTQGAAHQPGAPNAMARWLAASRATGALNSRLATGFWHYPVFYEKPDTGRILSG